MNQQNKATVLVAEDDTEIRTALERILRYEGYNPITVNDGAAALEGIVEHEPDLILLDVMMPFVDGLTVCRRLRERGNRTPVMMLTARHEISDRVAGLDAGADDPLGHVADRERLAAAGQRANRFQPIQTIGRIAGVQRARSVRAGRRTAQRQVTCSR